MSVTVLSMVISVDYIRLKEGYKAKRFYCLSNILGVSSSKLMWPLQGVGDPGSLCLVALPFLGKLPFSLWSNRAQHHVHSLASIVRTGREGQALPQERYGWKSPTSPPLLSIAQNFVPW